MIYKSNKMNIYYEKYGNNKNTILILPGWGDTRKTFINIINLLKDKYTIYIIDYPGFGNSPLPTNNLTIYDYAETIKELINYLDINPIIIAHSFGGRISSLLLSKYNLNIKKLILIDVAGIKRKSFKIFLRERIYKILKLLIKILPKRKKLYYHKKLLNTFGSSDYQNLPDTMKKTFQNIIQVDLRNYYKNINIETLIIWGEKDQDTPLKDAYYLHKHIKNSGLIIIKNASHFSYLENQLIINKILTNYLLKQ